jgi:hypothetical protein
MADQQLNESISSADTLDTFTYRPLQYNDETRVLQIVPDNDATVFFECRPVLECLSEDPEYAALSYTWGDTDANTPLQHTRQTSPPKLPLNAMEPHL